MRHVELTPFEKHCLSFNTTDESMYAAGLEDLVFIPPILCKYCTVSSICGVNVVKEKDPAMNKMESCWWKTGPPPKYGG